MSPGSSVNSTLAWMNYVLESMTMTPRSTLSSQSFNPPLIRTSLPYKTKIPNNNSGPKDSKNVQPIPNARLVTPSEPSEIGSALSKVKVPG
ncbi:unnamed protein product [Macrosiphum euphorbiae]|uniref:Uncharacterized protein n=1 Tax=Macrosiphum euphorbiae TaxID=13131 RepID=A0AAV0Y952_9HEMI|nr:unnamed protein product [Macrosiphum euphorbiae]